MRPSVSPPVARGRHDQIPDQPPAQPPATTRRSHPPLSDGRPAQQRLAALPARHRVTPVPSLPGPFSALAPSAEKGGAVAGGDAFGLTDVFSRIGLESPWAGLAAALVSANLLLVFVAASAIFFIWLER